MWYLPPGLAKWGLLALRMALGIVFMAHGAQKLFGAFGGHGLSGTAGFLGGMGFQPPMLWAVLLTITEFFGGLCVLLGFGTRFAAAAILISQIVAVATVHAKNGFFASAGGFEYNMSLIAICVALILSGSGAISLGSLLARR